MAKEPCQFDGHGRSQNGVKLDVGDGEAQGNGRTEKPQSSIVAVLSQKFNEPRGWLEGDGGGRDDEKQEDNKTEYYGKNKGIKASRRP